MGNATSKNPTRSSEKHCNETIEPEIGTVEAVTLKAVLYVYV